MKSDESELPQSSSHRSSSSSYEEENEEFNAATDRIDQPWDCCGWVKPYCDEPLVDKKWVGDYQARKQHVVDKYAEFNSGKAAKQLA